MSHAALPASATVMMLTAALAQSAKATLLRSEASDSRSTER
jgi:hypothetical protein